MFSLDFCQTHPRKKHLGPWPRMLTSRPCSDEEGFADMMARYILQIRYDTTFDWNEVLFVNDIHSLNDKIGGEVADHFIYFFTFFFDEQRKCSPGSANAVLHFG